MHEIANLAWRNDFSQVQFLRETSTATRFAVRPFAGGGKEKRHIHRWGSIAKHGLRSNIHSGSTENL